MLHLHTNSKVWNCLFNKCFVGNLNKKVVCEYLNGFTVIKDKFKLKKTLFAQRNRIVNLRYKHTNE